MPTKKHKASKKDKSKDTPQFAISGSRFTPSVSVLVGDKVVTVGVRATTDPSLTYNGPSLLTLNLPKPLHQTTKQIIIAQGNAQPVILATKTPTPPPPKPTVTELVTVSSDEEIYTIVTGTNLDSVAKVLFQGKSLKFTVDEKDNKTMKLFVTKDITENKTGKPVRKDLDFIAKDGTEIIGRLLVMP
jgi:hypothetical protein